jgi:hypothetical protein
MEHIQAEFNTLVQYICIASPNVSATCRCPPTYIQIILKRTINKKSHFLGAVAGWIESHQLTSHHLRCRLGMQCNYQVTHDDRAWNRFLRKGP